MSNAGHLVQRAGQLRSEQVYWQGVKQRANGELHDISPDQGLYTDNAQELLKSQIASANYHLEMIAQELNRIGREQEEQAREAANRKDDLREQAPADKESGQPEQARKEELARDEREKAEALQKEQALKTEALEKEHQNREFFENNEKERLAALEKEERDRQEIEKQEILKKEEVQQKEGQSDLDFLGEQLMEINEEWQYIQDQIAEEWQYIDDQIQEELDYSKEQAIEAVIEAASEVAIAIRNSVSEKESGQVFDEQRTSLEAFMLTEDFQGQSAETKMKFLEDRIKEQEQAEKDKFDGRADDLGNRQDLMDKLDRMHEAAREIVQREQEIEKRALDEIEKVKKIADAESERIKNADYDDARKTILLEMIAENVRLQEQSIREDAEKERRALYEKLELEREMERERLRELERQRQAEARARDFGFGTF